MRHQIHHQNYRPVIFRDKGSDYAFLTRSTIELRGEACDRLQNGAGAELKATFPCDIVLI